MADDIVFELLHSEIINYALDQSKDTKDKKDVDLSIVEYIGFAAGYKIMERLTREWPRFKDELDTMKFICTDFWTCIYKKQIDNLRTNHQGVYVLQDNAFRFLTNFSNGHQYLEYAPRKTLPWCHFANLSHCYNLTFCLLNAEGSGTTKSAKEWSVYVSNYKSKLKKVVADINADATATGGGPPQSSNLSELDRRFLALLGQGFGQAAPQVRVQLFPELPSTSGTFSQIVLGQAAPEMRVQVFPEQPSTSGTLANSQIVLSELDVSQHEEVAVVATEDVEGNEQTRVNTPAPATSSRLAQSLLPQRSRRQLRQRTRPLAPLDEARRILSQVEMQRAASDAANARAFERMAQSIERFSEITDRTLGQLVQIVERYVDYIVNNNT